MKTSLIHLGTALCVTAALAAQTTANSRDSRDRLASFVYTSLPDGLENPVVVMSGTDVIEIVLSKLSPSDPVKISADGIVRIVRETDNPRNPQEPEYQTIAQASIPDSVSKALIILAPVAKNPEGRLFNTRVLDLDTIKGGDSMFLNMTNLRIGVELGKSNILIEPGQIETHNPFGNSSSLTLPIRLSYFHPERSEWSMITASTVALYATRRELCIFNWNTRFNRVEFDSITLPTL